MARLILTSEAQGKIGYEFAERSITTSRNGAQFVSLGIAAAAFLTFLGSMIAVLMMRAP